MTPLPPPLGSGDLLAWRLHRAIYNTFWDDGEGSYLYGGRWSLKGTRAVYCSIDPATAILEVAVHIGFDALTTVAHTLTAVKLTQPEGVHIVRHEDVPDQTWLLPGILTAEQQEFGTKLLAKHPLLLIPSSVSRHSWNLIFVRENSREAYGKELQEPFILDPRLVK